MLSDISIHKCIPKNKAVQIHINHIKNIYHVPVVHGRPGAEVSGGKKYKPKKEFAYRTIECAQGDQPVRFMFEKRNT